MRKSLFAFARGLALGSVVGVGLLYLATKGLESREISETFRLRSADVQGEVRLYFSPTVSAHDRRLVEMGVGLAEPLFEASGIPMRATMYAAGEEEDLDLLAKYRPGNPERFLGATYLPQRDIWINIANLEGNRPLLFSVDSTGQSVTDLRDVYLLWVVIHELDHIRQVDLSEGTLHRWTEDPFYFPEISAEIDGLRALWAGFCLSYSDSLKDLAEAVSAPDGPEGCPLDSLGEDGTSPNLLVRIAANRAALRAPLRNDLYRSYRYLLLEYGVDAFDRYFSAFPEAASQRGAFSVWWEEAFRISFGFEPGELEERACAYYNCGRYAQSED